MLTAAEGSERPCLIIIVGIIAQAYWVPTYGVFIPVLLYSFQILFALEYEESG
jgi:hypothetical protein